MWRIRIVWRKIARDEWIKSAGFHLQRWHWNRRGLSEYHGSSHILHNCIYHFQIYSLIQWPPPVVCRWTSFFLLPSASWLLLSFHFLTSFAYWATNDSFLCLLHCSIRRIDLLTWDHLGSIEQFSKLRRSSDS